MRTSLLLSALALFSTAAAAYDTNQCGPSAGNRKCKDNKCCSKYGWCDYGDDYCLPSRVSSLPKFMDFERLITAGLSICLWTLCFFTTQPLTFRSTCWNLNA